MKKLYIILCFVVFTACKKESVQTYILEAQQKPEFVSFDVSSSILQIGELVSPEHKEVYKTIRKVNLTALPLERTTAENYTQEKEKLKAILKNSDYKKLMNFKKDGNVGALYYKGETDAIDEIIAFGYSDKLGVGLARIMGEKMNPVAIKDMVEHSDFESGNFELKKLSGILDFDLEEEF